MKSCNSLNLIVSDKYKPHSEVSGHHYLHTCRLFLSVAGNCLHCDIKTELAAHTENKPANMAWNIAKGHPIKCTKLHVPVWWCSVQGDTSDQAATWTRGTLRSQLL